MTRKKLAITKEQLVDLHHKQKMTINQIAAHYNVTWVTIKRRFNKYKIDILEREKKEKQGPMSIEDQINAMHQTYLEKD